MSQITNGLHVINYAIIYRYIKNVKKITNSLQVINYAIIYKYIKMSKNHQWSASDKLCHNIQIYKICPKSPMVCK